MVRLPLFVLPLSLFIGVLDGSVDAMDVSHPPILQWFESRYSTMQTRIADAFMAGYGAVWLPPPGRADTGNLSAGYDPYDRFDLGTAANPTLYGTEDELKALTQEFHQAGMDVYADLVTHHNGPSDMASFDTQAGDRFVDAGGYPGLNITLPNHIDGDFFGRYETDPKRARLCGAVTIDPATDFPMVRNPVPGFPNIRAGTKVAFGRLANVPDERNRRFYPDPHLDPLLLFDPKTGEQNLHLYPFNLKNPMAGEPIAENAVSYLMRNARWLVQVIGFDGFRIDAAKNMQDLVFPKLDRAVYRASSRHLLNGDPKPVFSFSEVYDGDKSLLQKYVEKTINPSDPGRIGANRDVLDFPLFFALRQNLSRPGIPMAWQAIRDASMDAYDDGLHNGSQGVMFVQSHDDEGPGALDNVAYAYTLLHPGKAIVYFNAKEFGTYRHFPAEGRGDALGGIYGDAITRLVQIRNTHGRGNYAERFIDDQGLFAYERQGSALVLLSNRGDSGFDSRRLHTGFAPGTPLLELTGHAGNPLMDPKGDFPKVIFADRNADVDIRFMRNAAPVTGRYHGSGYLIYGPSGPQAPDGLEVIGSSGCLENGVPTPSTNGTIRLTEIPVIRGDRFQVKLHTVPVTLPGGVRDGDADGDNALLKVDGIDADFTDANDEVTYGFETFKDKSSPLIGPQGIRDGEFLQTVSTQRLGHGYHYIEARAFRHRPDGGPAIYSSFRKVIYIE